MKKQVWHSGPPPSVGWWPASVIRISAMLRWWNGEYWSYPVSKGRSAKYAAEQAKLTTRNKDIEWRERPRNWPARSKT